MYEPLGRNAEFRSEVEVSPAEIFQAMSQVADLVVDHNRESEHPVRVDELAVMTENLFYYGQPRLCTFRSPCGAGRSHVAVDANGDVFPWR